MRYKHIWFITTIKPNGVSVVSGTRYNNMNEAITAIIQSINHGNVSRNGVEIHLDELSVRHLPYCESSCIVSTHIDKIKYRLDCCKVEDIDWKTELERKRAASLR